MKSTGKFNPITGDEIFRAEEHDIDFWDVKWEDLTDKQKVTFLSFIDAKFLGAQNEAHIKARFNYFALRKFAEKIRG